MNWHIPLSLEKLVFGLERLIIPQMGYYSMFFTFFLGEYVLGPWELMFTLKELLVPYEKYYSPGFFLTEQPPNYEF